MSDFQTYDSAKRPSAPFQTADGVEMPDDEPVVNTPPSERSEILIVTGPKGHVRGSKVYINGKEIPRLSFFQLTGEIDGHWEVNTTQSVGGGDV